MKVVKEHINEKFTDESDPIKDMSIGMHDFMNNFDKLYFKQASDESRNELKKLFKTALHNSKIVKIAPSIAYFRDYMGWETAKCFRLDYGLTLSINADRSSFCTGDAIIVNDKFHTIATSYKTSAGKGGVDLVVKRIKRLDYILESFSDDSDPITDMTIGMKKKLEPFLLEKVYNTMSKKEVKVIEDILKLPIGELYFLGNTFYNDARENYLNKIFSFIVGKHPTSRIRPFTKKDVEEDEYLVDCEYMLYNAFEMKILRIYNDSEVYSTYVGDIELATKLNTANSRILEDF